jgi:phage tail-like protein
MATENALALLQIDLPDGTVRTEPIPRTPFSLGRVAGNDLVLPDPKISRKHARLLVEEDRIHLVDLNSTNGTFVGDARLAPNQPYALRYGEAFQLGRYTLRLEPAPREEAEPRPEPPEETAAVAPETAEPASEKPPPEEGAAAEVAHEPEPEPAPRVRLGATEAPPPPSPPAEPPSPAGPAMPPSDEVFGVPTDKSRYLRHLPPIYEEHPFLSHFLLVFEGILTPIEQAVDNFDLYLDPDTAPAFFLNQLAEWLGMPLDEKWPEPKRRALVAEAADLYRRRGTRRGLSRHLEIYAGTAPEITEPEDRPHHFHVVLRIPDEGVADQATVERIIQANKPAHTTYSLEIVSSR